MKKITALVLAIIMTAAFTGCAPKEEPAAIEEPQATPEPEPQEVESTIEQNPVVGILCRLQVSHRSHGSSVPQPA